MYELFYINSEDKLKESYKNSDDYSSLNQVSNLESTDDDLISQYQQQMLEWNKQNNIWKL